MEEEDYDDFLDKMEEESAKQVMEATNKLQELKQKEKTDPVPLEFVDKLPPQKEESSDSEDLTQYKDELTQIKKKRLELLEVDHKTINYLPLVKGLYVEVPDVTRLTDNEVKEIRRVELEGCIVRGKRCPKPIQSWSQCGLNPVMLEIIRILNYDKPTPVQRQAIPAVMSGLDAIVCAKTGSGKTLAYVLPLLKHVLSQPALLPGDGPIAIVFVPIRELAEQINTEIAKFAKFLKLRTTAVFGGMGISSQIGALKRGSEIVVCTPGRMIDILVTNSGRITNLRRVSFVVLDEADRMFDLGFGPQIKHIIDGIRPDKQIVMFSATFPQSVEQSAREFLKKPIEIICGGRSHVSDTIDQDVVVLPKEDKLQTVVAIVKTQKAQGGRILIFTETQKNCDELYQCLMNEDIGCLLLHGGIDQVDRQNTINEFKSGVGKTVMVATSVCARGIDVKGLELVINYDCPNHMEDYVHRVGRTGRAGQRGKAITFITKEEDMYSDDIVKALTLSGGRISKELSELNEGWKTKKLFLETKKRKMGYGGSGFKFDKKEEIKNLETKVGAYLEEEAGGETLKERVENKKMEEEMEENKIPVEKREAVRKALEAIDRLNKKIAKATSDGYQTEVVINDFSLQSRFVLTNKEKLLPVMQSCNVKITTKGTYVPEGKPVPAGTQKLYLLIEGKTEEDLSRAKREIKVLLKEIADKYRDKVIHEKTFSNII
ncbi:DEAD box ATP-dependent RNA helicase, putative [Entamoeba invadens IP1]|uniref:RNA helicase n=1 Tax=Entamoeba invadens IP1 TaxID=370355 RepID=A0A0A1U0F4_ENTIV|nr:DEAD box ATP-dependent RNA helicase, putative [Entamoeba invadens IP1]ELP87354.1 DEAD box ATP-dependent RNA helicase, putative [Entamoeba invadens IP1]|eukprot:XP_004254125.1 DEAD box ATP-dependent RNA helicase, putative [Entamoeba invadens IP1]